MKGLTSDERQATIAAFVDTEDDGPALTVVDRSTLERYACCPAQAAFIAAGLVNTSSHIASAGEAVHQAFGSVIASYIASGGVIRTGELADELFMELRQSRPDVQPEAIRGMRSSAWAWCQYVNKLHPDNILRYDGGTGTRSGQLAWDLPSLGLRLTAEVDLLHTSPSPVLLCEVDYKTGWKLHGAQDVRDSFQFQMHAWLVLNNYPDVQALQVSVWNTRSNRRTWPVEFTRADLPAFSTRIQTAAGEWWKYRSVEPAKCPTWPTVEKCGICPAARLCPASGEVDTPEAMVDQLVAVEAKADAIRKHLGAIVDVSGDIVTPAGNAFGTGKPKADRRPTKATYAVKQAEPESEGEA